jgi:hypothetical protein
VLSLDAVQRGDPSDLTRRTLASIALLSADGVSRPVLARVLGADGDSARRLDGVLARVVEASLVVWTSDRGGVVMHRLVARAIRDRLQTAGELNASIASTVTGLGGLLVDEDRAWQERHASSVD